MKVKARVRAAEEKKMRTRKQESKHKHELKHEHELVAPLPLTTRLCTISPNDSDTELVEHASAGLVTPLSPVREPTTVDTLRLYEPERTLWLVVTLDAVTKATMPVQRGTLDTLREEAWEWIALEDHDPPGFDWVCESVFGLNAALARQSVAQARDERRQLGLYGERRRNVTYTSQIGRGAWEWVGGKRVGRPPRVDVAGTVAQLRRMLGVGKAA